MKLNQQLKYLNKGSIHTEACFAAIPSGVVRRLALLTMRMNESEDIRMDELYPLHVKALHVANLAPPIFPTHGKILDSLMMREPKENDKCNNNKKGGDKWMVQFCISMSKHWSKLIHERIKELCEKHGLKWLRVSISYHRFANLRGIFQSNLNKKLIEGVISRDFCDLECNCNKLSKVDSRCIFGGDCRKSCVVYKVTCRECDEFYIGNTQQKMKNCQGQHLNDVKKLVLRGESLDSFTDHFL